MGAGVLTATTVRLVTAAGGRFTTGLPEPNTLALAGSTATVFDTGAAARSTDETETRPPATGRAFTKVSRETTVTAPFRFRFAYDISFALRLTTTVL